MVAPRLRSQLVRKASTTRRWLSIGLGLVGAALIIVAIARPHVGETTTTEQIRTRNILIAIDTSRSMLVRDGSPDRMAAAQAMAIELLETFPNDRVGVIAFSGAPVLMAPLTIDHAAVHETISQLDTDVIPTGGSNLNEAVNLALATFEKTGQRANALIILSDGEDHSEQTELTADAIRDSKAIVCAIGVGTEEGGIIPDYRQPDRKFRDVSGQTVLSRMNPAALDTLSRAGGGNYLPASAGTSAGIRSTLASLKKHEQAGRSRIVPNEKYQWFLLPAILILTLSVLVRSQLFARQLTSSAKLTSIMLLLVCCSGQLQAAALERAEQAYERKDYEDALQLFKHALHDVDEKDISAIYFAMGSSAYRLKLWDQATSHFSMALLSDDLKLQENSHYNLGQALFRSGMQTIHPELAGESGFLRLVNSLVSKFLGTGPDEKKPLSQEEFNKVITQWEDSIAHYQAALDLNPDNQRASTNQNNVKRLLDMLQQAKQQGDESKDPENDDQGHRPETDPNNDPENPGNKDADQKEPGDKPDQNADNEGDGAPKDPKNKGDSDDGDSQDQDDQGNQQSNNPDSQPKEKPNMERKAGESDEAYSARILKENSDAETRPVQRRFLRIRRPAKDW